MLANQKAEPGKVGNDPAQRSPVANRWPWEWSFDRYK